MLMGGRCIIEAIDLKFPMTTPRSPTQKIRTIGKCIYCGTTEGKLSEEHIIPFALGANLTLGEASCAGCAKITGRVELHVTRPIAGMARIRLGLQSRNPKKRDLIPKKLIFEDTEKIVRVAPAEFPSIFSYPIFAKPGILEGRPRQGVYRTGETPWSQGQDDDFNEISERFKAKYGCTGFELASFQPSMLMSFVAKVGHAAAVALLGLDGFQPLLQEAAITPGQVYDDLLGGQGGAFAPNPDSLHWIEVRQIDGPAGPLIFARLCWFANLAPGRDPTLTVYPDCAPPPLLAIVGRPIDDRLAGKAGQIVIRSNGTEEWGVFDIPREGRWVAPPDMRPRAR